VKHPTAHTHIKQHSLHSNRIMKGLIPWVTVMVGAIKQHDGAQSERMLSWIRVQHRPVHVRSTMFHVKHYLSYILRGMHSQHKPSSVRSSEKNCNAYQLIAELRCSTWNACWEWFLL